MRTLSSWRETISPNSPIGLYTILEAGEGGMDEVWRARDRKLGRDVAIKLSPASLSSDKDRPARFEQASPYYAIGTRAKLPSHYSYS